jgi:glutamate racemase
MQSMQQARPSGNALSSKFRRNVLAWAASALVLLSPVSWPILTAAPPPEPIRVATFDSGFGGYLTAKSIEVTAASLLRDYDTTITIRHYGDTKNLPYGEKTPAQIATLGSAGVLKAFEQGADMVFIACNTASTQYAIIHRAVDAAYPGQVKPVVSIIDASTDEAKRLLDLALSGKPTATFTILATPATVRSMVYPRQLAARYGVPITEELPRAVTQPRWFKTNSATVDSLTQKSVIALPGGGRIDVLQLAPANWVELIEHGADQKAKQEAVRRDLGLLVPLLAQGTGSDVVGYFCTHYPIFDAGIRSEMASQFLGTPTTAYISQGQLMAKIFEKMAAERLKGHRRKAPASADLLRGLTESARANITISGQNGVTTRDLAHTMFPNDPAPVVTEEDLGSLTPVVVSTPK